MALGMNILDLYINKDGQRLDATNNDRFSSEKNNKDYTVELNFDIANLTHADEGAYSCVVESPTRSIQEDASFIIAGRLDIQLRIPWWNASMVSCFTGNPWEANLHGSPEETSLETCL